MKAAESFAGGRYELEGPIGRGGMASVHRAVDRELDRPVAVKVLDAGLALDDEFAPRFRREARTAAALSHPNVVRVFDFGEEGDRLYIVMELVDGEPLDALLRAEGRVAPDRVLELAAQACRGLQYAHEEGVVHRDVKPANLLLRDDGVLKIADFGIARAAEATQLTQIGTVLGTAAYLSPEQAAGRPATPRSDVYALGVVLYELLTGDPPRRIESLGQLAASRDEPIRPVRDLAPDVPEHVEAAVMRCLARNPDYRPATPAELAAALEAPAVAAAAPTAPLRPTARPLPGRRTLAAAAAVLLVALALVAALLTRNGGDTPAPRSPAKIEPVPAASDPAQEARNLARWIREHSRG